MKFVIFEIFTTVYLHKIGQEIKFLLINSLHEKKPSQEVKADRMSVLLCTCVTWKRQLFLANQRHLSFSYISLLTDHQHEWLKKKGISTLRWLLWPTVETLAILQLTVNIFALWLEENLCGKLFQTTTCQNLLMFTTGPSCIRDG